MPSLHIHQPCTADWKEMSATEQGAFCKSCSKEVIDFTQMSDEEIVIYFKARNNQPLCGRFNSDQLNKPLLDISPAVFRMEIPSWQKFLAAVFFYFASFLTGCSSSVSNLDRVQDEPVIIPTLTTIKHNPEEDSILFGLEGKEEKIACQNLVLGFTTMKHDAPTLSPELKKLLSVK